MPGSDYFPFGRVERFLLHLLLVLSLGIAVRSFLNFCASLSDKEDISPLYSDAISVNGFDDLPLPLEKPRKPSLVLIYFTCLSG